MQSTELLRVDEVARKLSVCRATVWNWARREQMPQPVRFGGRITRWRSGDIQDFVAGRWKPRAAA